MRHCFVEGVIASETIIFSKGAYDMRQNTKLYTTQHCQVFVEIAMPIPGSSSCKTEILSSEDCRLECGPSRQPWGELSQTGNINFCCFLRAIHFILSHKRGSEEALRINKSQSEFRRGMLQDQSSDGCVCIRLAPLSTKCDKSRFIIIVILQQEQYSMYDSTSTIAGVL